MDKRFSISLKGPQATLDAAFKLGKRACARDVITLSGELGAGKTTFVRGLAAGAGVDADLVSSPSYTLINEYPNKSGPPIYHFDLYRLNAASDVDGLGYEEYIEGMGVCVIEWADVAPEIIPDERLAINMDFIGDDARKMSLTAYGERYKTLLTQFESDCDGI